MSVVGFASDYEQEAMDTRHRLVRQSGLKVIEQEEKQKEIGGACLHRHYNGK